jgi:F-type H+-transporting ATPase subunit b
VLIDWFTVVAQIVNFLVLVALLKRFLYGPLVAAIDAREKSIADRLADAARKETEAAAHIEQLARQAADAEREKAALLTAARADADRQRGEILLHARENVKALEAKWRDELDRERSAFLDDVRRRSATEILAIARTALHDLANADLQRSAMNAFIGKLQSLDPALLRAFAAQGMTVVSKEDLTPELRGAVQQTIDERLGAPTSITFQRAPNMAWGVELRGNGQRIGWTPDAYLDSLEDKLRGALDKAAAASYPLTTA